MGVSKDKRNLTNKVVQQTTLPVNEASVEERQVTIQVLTLGAKQVTQALYRQLVEENVIHHHTGLLKGTPWGWVNLHIDCEETRKHLHVVWEDKGQLKRSCVTNTHEISKVHQRLKSHLGRSTEAYICLSALEGKKYSNCDDKKVHMDVNGYTYTMSLPEEVTDLWSLPQRIENAKKIIVDLNAGLLNPDESRYRVANARDTLSDIEGRIKRHKQAIKSHMDTKYGYTTSERPASLADMGYTRSEEAFSEVEKTVKQLQALENNWKTSYATIEQCGQLFIAVSGVWK